MTARSQKVKEAWKIFQVRRSGLMHPSVGIALGPGRAYRGDIDPPTASILYITVVSILDEATCSRLTNEERREHDTLHKRLKLLRDRKELLDYDALKTIRKCRNELAHKSGYAADPVELSRTCAAIQRQLVSWELASTDAPPPFKFAVVPTR